MQLPCSFQIEVAKSGMLDVARKGSAFRPQHVPFVSCVKMASYYDWLFIMHERTSMKSDPGFRLSRFAEQKLRARRVRIGVMLVLCALPVAVAFASIPTLLEVATM
ncbi:MAG: hypothetical protein EOO80_17200 [Oxalobacteraceae bacterium]|nr:MAG: hypothetical protein EOO80_17200 [Oxalobacteraceae bacterium]